MSDEPAYSSWYRAGHSVTADYASMRDRKVLANDRANIEAFLKQNEVLTQFCSTAVDALRGRLASAGVQHNLIDRIADEVASRFREWKITDSLSRERELGAKAKEIVDLLDKNWGNWSLTDSGALIFKRVSPSRSEGGWTHSCSFAACPP